MYIRPPNFLALLAFALTLAKAITYNRNVVPAIKLSPTRNYVPDTFAHKIEDFVCKSERKFKLAKRKFKFKFKFGCSAA